MFFSLQQYYLGPMLDSGLIIPKSAVERAIFGNIKQIEKIHQKV